MSMIEMMANKAASHSYVSGTYYEAVISNDHTYRYKLTRQWGRQAGSRVCWIMLNPSTADGLKDDKTISKIMRYSKRWGYHALDVVNLFAFRATDPKRLNNPQYPLQIVGIENDPWIADTVKQADCVIAAWGKHGRLYGREHSVLKLIRDLGQKYAPPVCYLKLNNDGTPAHPLYLKDTLAPQKWKAYE